VLGACLCVCTCLYKQLHQKHAPGQAGATCTCPPGPWTTRSPVCPLCSAHAAGMCAPAWLQDTRISIEGIMAHPWFTKRLPSKYEAMLTSLRADQAALDRSFVSSHADAKQRDADLHVRHSNTTSCITTTSSSSSSRMGGAAHGITAGMCTSCTQCQAQAAHSIVVITPVCCGTGVSIAQTWQHGTRVPPDRQLLPAPPSMLTCCCCCRSCWRRPRSSRSPAMTPSASCCLA
jgi:hypothetical protein